MAHQQESFLPFSSRQSLSCCLSRVAKRSTPKPHGPLSSLSEPCGPLPFPQNHMVLSSLHQSCLILSLLLQNLVVVSFPLSELCGPLSIYLLPNLMVLPLFPSEPCGPLFTSEPHGLPFLWLLGLGLNPSTHLPLQPHFQLLLHQLHLPASPYSSSFTGLP